MAWVVDERVVGLRNAAVNKLTQAVDQSGYLAQRCREIEGHTRVVIGHGHEAGDRLAADLIQAVAQLQQTQSLARAAISSVKKVNIMMWVPDDD